MITGSTNNEITITKSRFEESGLVYVPYVIGEPRSTSINGITVWYKNKWKNFFLKIKFLFFKPKELKSFEQYRKNPVNPKFYSKINVENNNLDK